MALRDILVRKRTVDKSTVIGAFVFCPVLGSMVAIPLSAVYDCMVVVDSVCNLSEVIKASAFLIFATTIFSYLSLVIAVPVYMLLNVIGIHAWWIYALVGAAMATLMTGYIFSADSGSALNQWAMASGVCSGLFFWLMGIHGNLRNITDAHF